MTWWEIALICILCAVVILAWVGLMRAAHVAGNVAGAFAELVLREVEKRRPAQHKVKRKHTVVLPLNCPECGLLMTHVVCPKCRNTYYELGNCPHCRQHVKAISCPSCGTVISW
jgi:hypothetical protein